MESMQMQQSAAQGTDRPRVEVPRVFGQIVADRLEDILRHQKPNGCIEYDPKLPNVYPQQAIMPLAFCYMGLDPDGRWKGDVRVAQAIRRLGDYLLGWYDDKGVITYHSHGNSVTGVDQRLTYAWVEGLRMLRDGKADYQFNAWGDKIARACETLMEHRLRKLQGVRRFIVRVTGTGTNHVCLYLTTIYRAGTVLGRQDLCDFVLPIARAFARDVHPDGYWDEHSDVLRRGGPTPSYNYLTMGGMSLMAEWTGEAVFKEAADRAARFHTNVCYPDGMFPDILDERVRSDLSPRSPNALYDAPRIWGLHAMSSTPEGRGSAALHMAGWLEATPASVPVSPESLARHVENYIYWHAGPIAPPPTDRRNHGVKLTLPGGLFRRGSWCIGLSGMASMSTEDDVARDNPFTLDRQKLFSVWHEQAGLVIDGSHSKYQPDNSTFAAAPDQGRDFYPVAGEIGEKDGELLVRAAFKSFFGLVRVRPVDDRTLRVNLSVDPAATNGPFAAAFTLRMLDRKIVTANGKTIALGEEPFSLSFEEMGGGFSLGPATIEGEGRAMLNWPMSPFNSYAADKKSKPEASIPRVSIVLTPQRPAAEFTLKISK